MQDFELLEDQFAKWNGLPATGMVCCSSGTAALHLALEAFRLPEGSEVIVPDFTMIACARAVVLAGLESVFVDCGEDLNIDPDLFDNNWEPTDVKAVMVVHAYGRRCDMESITRITEYNDGMPLIEDLAESHGIKPSYNADAACWSFYRNKIIAGAEGGAVYFRNPEHASLARKLRSLGFTEDHDFMHIPRGHNYRLSNVHAGLILDSLSHVERNLQQRRLIEQWYDAACPDAWRMPAREAVWVYDLRIPGMTSEQQSKIVRTLNENGIAARMAFKPMHLQPEFKDCQRISGEVAERMSREVFYLPVVPFATSLEQIERSFQIIRSICSCKS